MMIHVAIGMVEEAILNKDGLVEAAKADNQSHLLSTFNFLKLLLQAMIVLARLHAPQMALSVVPQVEKPDELEELSAMDLAMAAMAAIALDSRIDP